MELTPQLQRLQERDQLVLLRGAERLVIIDYSGGFAAVTQDSFVASEGRIIVHQTVTSPQSPQRSSAQLVGRCLSAVLHNAIARSYIVQQEVAEWVNDLAAQCRRSCERSAIDHCARRGGSNRGDMADVAADAVEQVCAGLCVSRGGQRGVLRRGLGRAHEAGETVDVIQAIWAGLVFRIGRSLA